MWSVSVECILFCLVLLFCLLILILWFRIDDFLETVVIAFGLCGLIGSLFGNLWVFATVGMV